MSKFAKANGDVTERGGFFEEKQSDREALQQKPEETA